MHNDYLDQAELCCDQARAAAGLRRFCSACGLYFTAINLLQYALRIGDKLELPLRQQCEERLWQIEQERAIYELLNTSHSRPLLTKSH